MSVRYEKLRTPASMSSKSSVDLGEVNASELEEQAFLGSSEQSNGHVKQRDLVKSQRYPMIRLTLRISILILSLSTLIAGYDVYRRYTTLSSLDVDRDTYPCQLDPVAARTQGCLFDVITASWLPTQCHDFELTKEFLEVHPWQFWEQPEDKNTVSLANIMQGRHSTLFVHEKYLRHRCVFAWRKFHRAIINKAAVDGYTADWNGLMECEKLFKDFESDSEELHPVTVGYPSCNKQL